MARLAPRTSFVSARALFTVRQPHLLAHLQQCASQPCATHDAKAQRRELPTLSPELESALRGLESVTGVAHIETLLQYAPSKVWLADINRNLGTWTGISRGSDVFIPGLRRFNIPQVYNHDVHTRWATWAMQFLNCVKLPLLRQECRRTGTNNSVANVDLKALAERLLAGDVDSYCSVDFSWKRSDLDLCAFLMRTAAKDGFTTRGRLSSDTYRLPLFVDTDLRTYHGHYPAHVSKNVNVHKLLLCLRSGALSYPVPALDLELNHGYDYAARRTQQSQEMQRMVATYKTDAASWWLLTLADLQVSGHFPFAFEYPTPFCLRRDALAYMTDQRTRTQLKLLLSMDEACPQRRHLIRYHDYWNDTNHVGALHEIAEEAASWKTQSADYCWPESGDTMPPTQLLSRLRNARRARELGPEVIFEHLDKLQDADGIRVLRSKHQIRDVGDRLRNCVVHKRYGEDVASGKTILAALDNSDGRPVALGRYDLHNRRRLWTEIRGPMNQSPSKDVLERFDAYLPSLKTWHDDLDAQRGYLRCNKCGVGFPRERYQGNKPLCTNCRRL